MLARRLPPSPHDSGGGSRGTVKTRNPKPETDSEDFTSPGPIETRNPKPTVKVGFELRNRNPTPETRNWQRKWVSIDETRNPKPDSESWFQATKPETRNRQRKLVSIDETRNRKPETRNPKPETRNRLESNFWVALRIGTRFLWISMDFFGFLPSKYGFTWIMLPPHHPTSIVGYRWDPAGYWGYPWSRLQQPVSSKYQSWIDCYSNSIIYLYQLNNIPVSNTVNKLYSQQCQQCQFFSRPRIEIIQLVLVGGFGTFNLIVL